MSDLTRVYVCNGLACRRKCAETMSEEYWRKYSCHHTTKKEFARYKVHYDWEEIISGDRRCLWEVMRNGQE